MKRKIIDDLNTWRQSTNRKPLVLHGARQVGKTYILHEFGETYYDTVVHINLESNVNAQLAFAADLSPKVIIPQLEAITMRRIMPGKTLLILDEIQACPRALTSLKSFQEEAPEYHVAAAGSLLGVAVHRDHYSFPVGKVYEMAMYPMDFEEFLWAMHKEQLATEIRTHFETKQKMPLAMHADALDLFHRYMVVGGMPEAVGAYVTSNSILPVQDIQKHILNDYIADMAKYTVASMVVKVRACFNSIPTQLAKENHKFQYKVVQRGGSSTLFGESIEWLNQAGITLPCQHVENAIIPIAANVDLSDFKLYMCDVGLLTQKSAMPASMVLSSLRENITFTGALTENYVAQTLRSKGYPLYYWRNQNTAELDFLLVSGEQIIPIEVKSGLHVRSRSLNQYMQCYHPNTAYRLSTKNFGYEDGIFSIPLYAAFCI